jgi:hypothetical protein
MLLQKISGEEVTLLAVSYNTYRSQVLEFIELFPARLWIKKKQRALNLERSVSDLTNRAEELEKEAADLRRENGWLKEIIVMRECLGTGGPADNVG